MKPVNFYYLALAAALPLASCSSELQPEPEVTQPTGNVVTAAPARSASVDFVSNGVAVGEDAPQGLVPFTEVSWDNNGTMESVDIYAAQKFVKEFVGKQTDNRANINLDNVLYVAKEDMTLTMVHIYDQANISHSLGLFYYDKEGNRVEQIIARDLPKAATAYSWDKPKTIENALQVRIPKGVKFGFYINGWADSDETPANWYSWSNLNAPIEIAGQSGSTIGSWFDKLFGKGESSTEKKTETAHVGTFANEEGTMTYICFEDFDDFDFNDLVFVCTPKIETTTVIGEEEEKKEELKPEPDPEPTPEPEPEPILNNGHVEVNLALNAENVGGDWLESHLAIHVRDTTDVTVFLSVPVEYYCSIENSQIAAKHDEDVTYNETLESFTHDVNGTTVTMNITYSENGITVASQGITADVLKYLRATYADGLTFEIKNYYNIEAVTRAELIGMLSQGSNITFAVSPLVYVNSLGRDCDSADLVRDPLACTVWPVDKENRTLDSGVLSEREKAVLDIYVRK